MRTSYMDSSNEEQITLKPMTLTSNLNSLIAHDYINNFLALL